MPISFNNVLIIAGISVFVPVVLGLLPRLPVPGAVLEVIALTPFGSGPMLLLINETGRSLSRARRRV
jgi:hypothetical protein